MSNKKDSLRLSQMADNLLKKKAKKFVKEQEKSDLKRMSQFSSVDYTKVDKKHLKNIKNKNK